MRALASAAVSFLFTLVVAGCDKDDTATPRPSIMVRVMETQYVDYVSSRAVTGAISARTVDKLSFRIAGRIVDRPAFVGGHVDEGMLLARLAPQEQRIDLRSAEAELKAAEATLRQATRAFVRQKALLSRGFTTRRAHDQAEQALKVAEGDVEIAGSLVENMRNDLSFTDLRAPAAGIVTARYVEIGQYVRPAQTVFTVAVDGDRDAVFDVDEKLAAELSFARHVAVSLTSNPDVVASAELREMSPVIDPTSGSIRVKVTIPNTPPNFALGTAVTGQINAAPRKVIILPWQALTSTGGLPSVWVVDRRRTVESRVVGVYAYDPETVVIDKGLIGGEYVVTAGGQLLRPGQPVAMEWSNRQ